MSQISPPLRIVLVGSVLFLAAYMLFLRPGGGSDTATPAPASTPAASSTPASAPGKAVQAAKDAAAATEAKQDAEAAASGETPSTTATAPRAAATPGAATASVSDDLKGLPAPVAKAVAARKVLVLLFWNPKAADDRAVRAQLRKVDRHQGRVVVHVADVGTIARYARIAQGVDVQQSPSVVVVDADRRATLLAGYVDAPSIDQAVVDAMGPAGLVAAKPVNAYFKKVDALCAKADSELDAPRATTPAAFATLLTEATAVSSAYDAKFRKLETPAKYQGFRKAFAAYNAKGTALLKSAAVDAKAAKTPADVQVVAARVSERSDAMLRSGAERFGKYGIASCLS